MEYPGPLHIVRVCQSQGTGARVRGILVPRAGQQVQHVTILFCGSQTPASWSRFPVALNSICSGCCGHCCILSGGHSRQNTPIAYATNIHTSTSTHFLRGSAQPADGECVPESPVPTPTLSREDSLPCVTDLPLIPVGEEGRWPSLLLNQRGTKQSETAAHRTV